MSKLKTKPNPIKKRKTSRIHSRGSANSERSRPGQQVQSGLTGVRFFAKPAQEKIIIIKAGISKNELVKLKDQVNLDYEVLSQILSIAKTTIHNKKGNQKFDTSTSEKILSLADLYSYGYDVFEDKDSFNRWMGKTSVALGDKRPLDYMDTLYGIEEIRREIGRIEWGVY